MGEVTIYTRDWSGDCLRALAFLVREGIPYREVSLTHAPELASELVRRFGHDRVPLLVVGERLLSGHEDLLACRARGELAPAAGLAAASAAPAASPVRPLLRLRLPRLPLLRLPGRGTSRPANP
jgi:glutaredoxin